VMLGPGVSPGVTDTPISARRVYHTILDWAGLSAAGSLRAEGGSHPDVVLAEAMKPFLEYGWQPQIMAISGTQKSILAGRMEIYDLASDPRESHDLTIGVALPPAAPSELRDYPIPSPDAAPAPADLGADARKRLASLGYVSAGAAPVVRKDAPRPAEMASMFPLIEQASGLFVEERYAQVIPLLEKILLSDRFNLDAMLRLATAHSMLGHDARAVEVFARAAELAPRSPDVRTYLALHYARGREWERAVPMLERIVADMPERLPALEALASIRVRQDRPGDAVMLLQKAYGLREASPAEWVKLGQMAMAAQQTGTAIEAFSRAQRVQGIAFTHDLELGVLYLSMRRLDDARVALDRVPATHADYPMALFKRAQVSVLLNEPDAPARIDAARRRADATTRALIANEKLFVRK
jgi:tetratricopeptide (TPR) repeat protein